MTVSTQSSIRTLNDVLIAHRGVTQHIGFLESEGDERRVTYAELHDRALGMLHHLQGLGAGRGAHLILFLNNNAAFLDGFCGALLGGIVPVPLAVGIADEHRAKLLRIAKQLGAPYLFTDRRSLERLEAFAVATGEQAVFEGLQARALVIDAISDLSVAGAPVDVAPGDTAFIQFSSGSTREPKGVVLTHANILANTRGVTLAAGFSARDVSLSWMPLTHDMGLIGFFWMMFVNRIQLNLMPTDLFVRRPLLWTKFAAAKRATILCSPNFGYRHYLKVLGERAGPADDDLSSVRLIFNGAEPISVPLCEEFMSRLAPQGLARDSLFPVYGLAEATLAVSFPPPGRPWRTLVVDRHHLNVGEPLCAVDAGHRDALEFMSVGQPLSNIEVRIADDTDRALPEGCTGHVLIRGPSVTAGYHRAPEANAALITADGWLRTGDLGLVAAGELYITGRAKDIIFVGGQNYYPHDLEHIAERAAGLELGKVVAIGLRPPGAESDELTLFVLYRGPMAGFLPVAAEVAALVNEHAGLEVVRVVPVQRIPKTTSGKVQRHLLEQAWLDGEFTPVMQELARLATQPGAPARADGVVQRRLKAIVDAALPGKRIGVDDNLFEIGASSLTLIQIHERIDAEYPGLIDLTELFDFPTVAELARHLDGKLAAAKP
jgi:acyl-CoA synthetase (AMP-forming)/AMP-acid ligase II